jgi:hypothetical protein
MHLSAIYPVEGGGEREHEAVACSHRTSSATNFKTGRMICNFAATRNPEEASMPLYRWVAPIPLQYMQPCMATSSKGPTISVSRGELLGWMHVGHAQSIASNRVVLPVHILSKISHVMLFHIHLHRGFASVSVTTWTSM